MALIVIAIVIGLSTKQEEKFWKYVVFAIATQLLTDLLFSGRGTLQNPAGDGLITQFVRSFSNDGPIMASMIIPALLFGWGLPIFLIYRGYKKTGSMQKN